MKCSVCYESFDLLDRRPKILPCGHTFCLSCLRTINSPQCPTCRQEYTTLPSALPDNFISLEESTDVQTVLNSLWCCGCCAVPRVGCVEAHDIRSSAAVLQEERGALRAMLQREEELHELDMKLCDDGRTHLTHLWSALQGARDSSTAAAAVLVEQMSGGDARHNLPALQEAVKLSRDRVANILKSTSMIKATNVQLRFNVDDEWVSYSLDGRETQVAGDDDPGASAATASERAAFQLLTFIGYALHRLQAGPRSGGLLIRAAVRCESAGADLPDVTLELSEAPSAGALRGVCAQGWRRYGLCRRCLESCHAQSFTPLPPDEAGSAAVERGAVCLGRTTGRYYIILCSDMQSRFLLPLTASFKVVGRVSRNLDALESAVRRADPGATVYISPLPAQE